MGWMMGGEMKDQLEGKSCALREMETGGRLGCCWLTDVRGRRRLKQSQEATLNTRGTSGRENKAWEGGREYIGRAKHVKLNNVHFKRQLRIKKTTLWLWVFYCTLLVFALFYVSSVWTKTTFHLSGQSTEGNYSMCYAASVLWAHIYFIS